METKIKAGILFGGKSVEHEISVISALQACLSFDKEKYDLVPIYITKNGEMYTGEDIGKIESYKDIPALLKRSERVLLAGDGGKAKVIRFEKKLFKNDVVATLDVCVPIVHGTNVEDGTLQGFLKTLGVPYAGCDVMSSALGMDKFASKEVLRACGIPVLPCVTVSSLEYIAENEKTMEKIEGSLTYPVIVKPVNLGSSVGIKLAKNKEELVLALDYAFDFSTKVLVEKAVQNLREINCSVLGDKDGARSSVCEEPLGSDEILSYADKYLSGGTKSGTKCGTKCGAKCGGAKSGGMADTKRIIPANIPAELEERVRSLAVQTFLALGCSGVARIDFLNDKESGELYVNEINTIPGSLSFYLWDKTDKSYTQLLDEIVALAFKRERDEKNLNYSFDTNILSGISFGAPTGKA